MDTQWTRLFSRRATTKATRRRAGVLRRQALNIGAERTHADLIATGHNADDNAETGIGLDGK